MVKEEEPTSPTAAMVNGDLKVIFSNQCIRFGTVAQRNFSNFADCSQDMVS